METVCLKHSMFLLNPLSAKKSFKVKVTLCQRDSPSSFAVPYIFLISPTCGFAFGDFFVWSILPHQALKRLREFRIASRDETLVDKTKKVLFEMVLTNIVDNFFLVCLSLLYFLKLNFDTFISYDNKSGYLEC